MIKASEGQKIAVGAKRRFAYHDGVKIEYLIWEHRTPKQKEPLILIPGMIQSSQFWADHSQFIDLLTQSGRDVIAISLRGRGQSDTPEKGWSGSDHQGDILAVLNSEKIRMATLIGHSIGGAYALGFALKYPTRTSKLVIGDYIPLIPPVNEEWAKQVKSLPDPVSFNRSFPRRLLAESQLENYIPQLPELRSKLLVIQATGEGAVLDPDALALYEGVSDKQFTSVAGGHENLFTGSDAQKACVQFIEN